MKSALVDLTIQLHHETPKAILVSDAGKGWARPRDEFTDGRFQPVEPRS